MKKNILSILLIGLLVIGISGCGKKEESNENANEEMKVGKLDLEVEAIGAFHEGLAFIKQEGKYGFIDKSGETVIEPQFRKVGNFSDGLAPACTGDSYSNQKCGYIDKEGKTVVEFKYQDANEFLYGYGVVKSGIVDSVIDKKGNELLNFTHSYSMYLGPISDNLFIVQAKDTLKGLAIVDKNGNVIIDGIASSGKNYDGLIQVKQVAATGNFWADGKWGFIDETGKLVIDYQYDYAGNYVDGLAGVVKDGKYGFINKDNKYVIEPTFEYGKSTTLPNYSDGLVEIYVKPTSSFYNTKGEKVFEKNNDYNIQNYKNGYATFIKDDKYGYMDKEGKVVIENKYQIAFDYNDGLAKVYTSYDSDKETGEFLFINKEGKTILGGKIVKNASISKSTNNNSNETNKDKDDDSTKKNENDNSSNSNSNNSSSNTNTSSNATSSGIKVGSYTIKYGTYKGDAAVSGDTLVLKSDGTATLNGEKFTYKVGKHDFAQDSSSSAVEDCLILEGSYTNYYYVTNNGKTLSQGSGMDYIYSE